MYSVTFRFANFALGFVFVNKHETENCSREILKNIHNESVGHGVVIESAEKSVYNLLLLRML